MASLRIFCHLVNYVGFSKSEIVSLDEAETCRVDVDLGNFMSSAVMEGVAYILIGVGLIPVSYTHLTLPTILLV